jgi:hypothetical protein
MIIAKNRNIAKNNNETTQQMKPQHHNNTFIDKKKCPLSSSRRQPLVETISITIILKTRLFMPSNPIYTKSIYKKKNLEEDLPEAEASIMSSYI